MGVKATIPVVVGMMLLTGVSNTLLTKYQDMQCVANCQSSRPKTFEQPVIQTLQMFIGESGCWLVVLLSYLLGRRRKAAGGTAAEDTGYQSVRTGDDEHNEDEDEDLENDLSSSQTLVDPTNAIAKPLIDAVESGKQRLPLTGWKITMLALPAVCDILGTTLMNVGLLFVAASIYQMTRGALVLFVGLFSVIFLKRHLGGWKWASLFIVVLGVAVVGLAGALANKEGTPKLPGDTKPGHEGEDLGRSAMIFLREAISTLEAHTPAETILGVLMIAGAQIFTATQFVVEESIMEKYSMEPIQVVGWEGIFGCLVTLLGMVVLHAVVGQTPAGQGGYFDAREGFYEIFHNRAIAVSSLLIMVSIGGFNFFGLSVTRSISATARSTIDTCRTLFIWLVSLGLGWETFKWLQVLGFVLLVYGTALFNDIVQPPTIAFLRRRRQGVALGESRS
ncbi:hypothetical protein LTR78_005453 [Recurvomyces mirabilis]|uniref:Integral membrane protein n=1 Tax=Recurvomyces mirabilis TaxID=574656 RepID=A0AAE0WN33_9PEZI|nr:hypothetical protein LTR78_005453 [Recurvomyces mirabilis]KAK5152640.1 hypothetical protein LTS14_008174 [Recurvomyces mirabilis]